MFHSDTTFDYSAIPLDERLPLALTHVKRHLGSDFDLIKSKLSTYKTAPTVHNFAMSLWLIRGVEGYWPVRAFFEELWPDQWDEEEWTRHLHSASTSIIIHAKETTK